RFRRLRAELLRDVALGLAPDLVLVDHEPLGHKGEFSDGLSALKAQSPGTKFVFGLRDIMDDIGRIRGQWRELGVYDALEHLYDGIAVYGQPDLFDVADAYAIPESVRPKLHYCGYVVRDLPTADATVVRRRYGLPERGLLLTASVGSGSDGYPVLDAACTAVERLRRTFPDLVAVLVTGPFMPAGERTLLEARAPGARDHPRVRWRDPAHRLSRTVARGRLMDAAHTQRVLSAALAGLHGGAARLERWSVNDGFTAYGKRRVVRYELEATVRKGTSRRYEWLGKFYDEDRDARRVA